MNQQSKTPTYSNTDFAARLQDIVKARRWSHATLATVAGVDKMIIHRIFNKDNYDPKITHVVRIAKALGMTIDQLVGIKADIQQQTPHKPIVQLSSPTPIKRYCYFTAAVFLLGFITGAIFF